MKKLLTSMMLCVAVVTFSFAQTDATLSTQLIGIWNMESMDFGGQIMTAEQLKTTMQQEYIKDGTTKYDDMMSGEKKTAKWKVIDGVVTNPDEPNAPSPKIVKLDDASLILELIDNGTTIKINMKRVVQ